MTATSDAPDRPAAPVRVATGIRGLDEILGGGLFKGGIYIVSGFPGSGKTTFGNQVSFHHGSRGGHAVYVTLLSETHARMLFQMRSMSFFDEAAIGSSLVYLNGFSTVEKDGLQGLLTLIRQMVRDRQADLLVLDGMLTAGALAKSDLDYKKFINELQTWVGFVGCTVVFLTSAGPEAIVQPEHTMVDGIMELATQRSGMRSERHVTVTKFRGSAFLEGSHAYRITGDGILVYPRLEGLPLGESARRYTGQRLKTGVEGLDPVVGGGWLQGSSTLLVGSSGAGKTVSGLQFLVAGARNGERCLYFGFSESPASLLAKAERLGLGLTAGTAPGAVELVVKARTTMVPDELAHELLARARDGGFQRVFVDGVPGFKAAFLHRERVAPFLAALVTDLLETGATAIFSDETADFYTEGGGAPTAWISPAFENVAILRQQDSGSGLARTITVVKTRDSDHDQRAQPVEIGPGGLRVGLARGARAKPARGASKAATSRSPRRRR
jgi:circadian clock protein KaiC